MKTARALTGMQVTGKERGRFDAQIKPVRGGCWEWQGSLRRGYGSFFFRGQRHQAHRVSYFISRGDIPPRRLVLHHCDNRRCVNPEHLYLGNMSRNALDASSRRRHFNALKTKCPKGHRYTPDNIYWQKKPRGRRARVCRRCTRRAQNERYHRLKERRG